VEALPLPLVELPPVERPLLQSWRRKRVCRQVTIFCGCMLIFITEKEESDEDMGFGLFD
jgi:hypothetical protein